MVISDNTHNRPAFTPPADLFPDRRLQPKKPYGRFVKETGALSFMQGCEIPSSFEFNAQRLQIVDGLPRDCEWRRRP